ncbi:MAG: CBS domain-containing protein [Saprospiraceae bacterium]|nr:CBS domain-containing protein [Saprospiraceae bacterium]
MKNEIIHRVYDFIKEFPPFSMLPKDVIMTIAGKVIVKYLPPNSVLFEIGDMPPPQFYIVNEGAIHLYQGDGTMVDQCDEGDIFGIRPLLAQSPYLLSAKTEEESIVYAIKTETFLPYLEQFPKVLSFLAANFAVGTGNMFYKKNHVEGMASTLHAEIFKTDMEKAPVYCQLLHTIQDAAIMMADHKIGSIIICNEAQKPIGIITDKDLRIKVVAGDVSKIEKVAQIMSSPVICVRPSLSIAELQIIMIKNRINHLAVTEDGTVDSRLIGVVSDHDLVVQQADNPSILIKEIRKCTSSIQLKVIRDKTENLIKKYIDKEVSIPYITQIVSEINDDIILRCIQIAEVKIGKEKFKDIKYCWISLGSEGRQEQLLRTDQDNALIYHHDPNIINVKETCLSLAKEVTSMLHDVGYEYCPADMMASNPAWCQSIAEWKNTFSKWIHNPGEKEIMMCTIFFDYRPVYGDLSLVENLTDHIFGLLDQQEVFLQLLAKNALENPPPLSFFRNFIVEKNGEHKDSFDIKLRAMMPLVDAARLLILSRQIKEVNNTSKRFLALAESDPNNAELYHMAADAYEILIRIRTSQGFQSHDSGRYIQPEMMDKMQRLQLRNAFQPIDEIQKLIKIKFQIGGII